MSVRNRNRWITAGLCLLAITAFSVSAWAGWQVEPAAVAAPTMAPNVAAEQWVAGK